MPANLRQTLKQELDRAANNVDMALSHVKKVGEFFEEHHPEATELCELIGAGMMASQEGMKRLRDMI